MTHIDQGNYRGKHPDGDPLDNRVADAIGEMAKDTRISCLNCEKLAEKLSVSIEEVGRNADLLEIQVNRCQLGLFGYGKKDGKSRLMVPAETVSAEMESAIRDRLEGGKLTCLAAWEIADRLDVTRVDVCAACEKLGIKNSVCQIGAF